MSGEEIVKLIESGDRVWIGNTINVPYDQLDLLADRYEELHDVKTYSNVLARPPKMFTDAKYGKAFHHMSFFPGPVEHMARKLGLVSFISAPYGYFQSTASKAQSINVVFIEVGTPDEDGLINIGAAGAFLASEIIKGGSVTKLIGVINESHTPAKCDDPELLNIPVERFCAFCENTHPHIVITDGDPEPVDEKIAGNIMKYVENGDTVQVGKGGLGNAIGSYLMEKEEINVYSEILSDWIVDLCQKGVAKEVRAAGFFGSQRLYDFCTDAKEIVYDSVPHLASINEVSKIDSFVAINACMMADLTGQSCSEGSGTWQYSCIGGQIDFVKGANLIRNRGGKGLNFLALRSTRTDKEGNLHSNVVFNFPLASAVTCPRCEAMYYVTEYGVADLWGKSLAERVVAMISIAHPDFREGLKKQALESGLVLPSELG